MKFRSNEIKIACLSILLMGSALAMDVKRPNQASLDEQLRNAAEACNANDIEKFLASGANVNAQTGHSWPPLFWALYYGKKEICSLLIAHGADVNASISGGYTALMLASQNKGDNNKEICEMLIANKAEVNAQDKKNLTALMLASDAGNKTICEFLITRGALVNLIDQDGNTALSLAASRGKLSTCELLLSSGADIEAGNALIEAIANQHWEVCKLLIARGANVCAQTNDNYSALAFVGSSGNQEICKLIMQRMIKPTKEQLDSMGALLGSIKRRRTDLAKLIGGSDVMQMVNQAPEKLMREIRQQNKPSVEIEINKIKNPALKTELLQYLNTL